ncbi:MAG: hypothetical protein QOE05_533 [Actinomycetota bacterium]|jgi:uncharacterized Tic20 family protein|nr:hypothetical protein [Actinomycetota bacterium]
MTTPPGWNAPPSGWQPPAEDTTWAVLAHLSFFALGLIAPLVIYLVKKDESPFSRHHAAEALNFHITLAIAGIVSAVLILVLIGILLLVVVFIGGAVLSVVAALAAGRREWYRYPLTIRFVH